MGSVIRHRAILWVGGLCVPVAAAGALGTSIAAHQLYAAPWFLPWTVAYVGGVLAVRARPAHQGAARLLKFGATAVTWSAAGYVMAFLVANGRNQAWLVVPNAAVVGLDFAMPVSLLWLLASYPDGDLDRRYERTLRSATAVLPVVAAAVLLLGSAPLEPALAVKWAPSYTHGLNIVSPLHLGVMRPVASIFAGLHEAVLPLLPGLGLGLLLLRRQGATAERRRRMSWPLAATLAIVVVAVADALGKSGVIPLAVRQGIGVVAVACIPVAFTAGIVHPDLIDVPRAVRQSVTYGALWAAIAAVYVGVAAALGIAAGARQAAVLVTIGATLCFQPAWRRMRRSARRRMYGERAAPEELLRRFGEALEHTLDLGELAPVLAETIREGMGLKGVRLRLGTRVDVAGELIGELTDEPIAQAPRWSMPASNSARSNAQVGSTAASPRQIGNCSKPSAARPRSPSTTPAWPLSSASDSKRFTAKLRNLPRRVPGSFRRRRSRGDVSSVTSTTGSSRSSPP